MPEHTAKTIQRGVFTAVSTWNKNKIEISNQQPNCIKDLEK